MSEYSKDRVKLVNEYVGEAFQFIESLEIYPREMTRSPFDSVAFELISKSFSIVRACLILLENDQAEEAYSLSRSLVEISLILRHITRDRSRQGSEAAKFLEFSIVEKNFWLFHAKKNISGTNDIDALNRYAAEWNLSDSDPLQIARGWSSDFKTFAALKEPHPLDGTSFNEQLRVAAYAIDYTQTSQHVHCSQPGLDNFFPVSGTPFKIKRSTGEYMDWSERVPTILIGYLHSIIRYALFGLDQSGSNRLTELISTYFGSLVS